MSVGSVSNKASFLLGLSLTVLVSTIFGVQTGQIEESREGTPKTKPVTVADAIEMRQLVESGGQRIVFSPDGRRFVVILKHGDLRQNTNQFELFSYRTSDVFNSSKPETVLRMSSSSNRDAIGSIRWLADGENFVFLGENPGECSAIYRFNVRTKRLDKLTQRPTAITNYVVSPDGQVLLYLAEPVNTTSVAAKQIGRKGVIVEDQNLYDLISGRYGNVEGKQLFVQRRGEKERQIAVGADYFISDVAQLGLSPDGRYGAIGVSLRRIPQDWALYRDDPILERTFAPLSSKWKAFVNLSELVDLHKEFVRPILNAPMALQSRMQWSTDGRTLFFRGRLPLNVSDKEELEARKTDIYYLAVTVPDLIVRKLPRNEWPKEASQDPPLKLVLDEDLNTPPRLYVSDAQEHQKTLLFDPNPQLKALSLGKVERITWTVADGYELQGGLYFPHDYVPGNRYPLVIQTHIFDPKRFSMDGALEWSSAFAARPLAAHGLMVLQVFNFVRSSDASRDLSDRKLGATPEQAVRNLQKAAFEGAIELLDRRGLVDKMRVGIVGFSATVCDVAYTLTHSTYHFAAASLVDGVDCGYFQEIAYPHLAPEFSQVNGGAMPFGKGLSAWLEQSPTFALGNVNTPVRLLALGSADVLQQWEWFVALSLQRKPVEYVVLPDAAHLVVKPWERMSAQQGLVDWLCFWLKSEEDPDPAKTDQYARWRELQKLQRQNSTKPQASSAPVN